MEATPDSRIKYTGLTQIEQKKAYFVEKLLFYCI